MWCSWKKKKFISSVLEQNRIFIRLAPGKQVKTRPPEAETRGQKVAKRESKIKCLQPLSGKCGLGIR